MQKRRATRACVSRWARSVKLKHVHPCWCRQHEACREMSSANRHDKASIDIPIKSEPGFHGQREIHPHVFSTSSGPFFLPVHCVTNSQRSQQPVHRCHEAHRPSFGGADPSPVGMSDISPRERNRTRAATVHPSATGALVFFILLHAFFNFFTMQLVDHVFAGARNALTEGSLKP